MVNVEIGSHFRDSAEHPNRGTAQRNLELDLIKPRCAKPTEANELLFFEHYSDTVTGISIATGSRIKQ